MCLRKQTTILTSHKKQEKKPAATENDDKSGAPADSPLKVSIVQKADHFLTTEKDPKGNTVSNRLKSNEYMPTPPFVHYKHTKRIKKLKKAKAKISIPERIENFGLVSTVI